MKGYDEKCKELARYFLPKGTANVAIVDLAQTIQDAVEDWLQEHERIK